MLLTHVADSLEVSMSSRSGVGWSQVVLTGCAAVLYFAVLEVYERTDGRLASRWFAIWAAMVVLSALVWVEVLRIGLRRIREVPDAVSTSAVVRYVAIAAGATWLLRSATSRAAFVDDDTVVGVVVALLLLLGWVVAAPWTLLVWHAHAEHVHVERAVDVVEPARWDAAGKEAEFDAEAVRAATRILGSAWATIEAAAIAFAVVLSTVVLNTGTLRLAALGSDAASPEQAPAVFVLAYGAFFAVVAAALIAPLAVPWRQAALRLVNRALGEPPTGMPTTEYVAAHDRFLAYLGLRAGVLRTPITSLSVLAPFGTAFVAALVPTA